MKRHLAFAAAIGWAAMGLAAVTGAGTATVEEAQTVVPIVVEESSAATAIIAAEELARGLRQIYPSCAFPVARRIPETGKYIRIGGALAEWKGMRIALNGEAYRVAVAKDGPQEVALIHASTPYATIYSVYALLERLGFGFYLTYDAPPRARKTPFTFDGWNASNLALARERVVFNWHNFLSGCSTWNFDDWKTWIVQAQKMGYNGIMVHAYGNNPMAGFTFNGREKPVGYLSTTRAGRDWSTQHVNDVRRLWGGFVFKAPVFGCEAAMGPDDRRVAAAQRLMHDVLACAEERAMNVYFAVDVDTPSALPQPLIETLPESARFAIATVSGKLWAPMADTPEGYAYYKAQVEQLLRVYPQMDCLVVWFRRDATPLTTMKLEEMPQKWQEEFRAKVAELRATAKERAEAGTTNDNLKFELPAKAHNYFALGKIVAAFERAVQELNRSDVKIATGSWGFEFLPGCDPFMPRNIAFIALDWDVLKERSQLRDAESRRFVRSVGEHRPVLPVVWAQHDDGRYLGRPYTPFSKFQSQLDESGTVGFGIIHWTMRPLDLYFKSLGEQVWKQTRNRPLRETCMELAAKSFGETQRDTMGEYLLQWVTEAPMFGRDTSDYFIDRRLASASAVAKASEARLHLLNSVDEALLNAAARDRLNYFKGLERYIVDVHRTEESFQRAKELHRKGDLDGARREMSQCKPEKVIEEFARFSSLGGITRGEQGLVVTMNLRWLTHFVRLRQGLGMDAVRYNFAPTSHDPLAQSAGTFTFHFSPDRKVWECFGEKETGAATFVVADSVKIEQSKDVPAEYGKICRTGIAVEKPLTLTVQPIMAKGGRGPVPPVPLSAGRYTLTLLLLDPESQRVGENVLELRVGELPTETVDVFKESGGANRVFVHAYELELKKAGTIAVEVRPKQGKAFLCGMVLETAGGERGAQNGEGKLQ